VDPKQLSRFVVADDLLIIILGVIALLLVGIIVMIIHNFLRKRSVDHVLARLLKKKSYAELVRIAREYLEKNKEKSRDTFFLNYYLARAYEALGNFVNAAQFFNSALVKSSKLPKMRVEILYSLATVYEKMGRGKEALAHYMMLLDEDVDHVDAIFAVAKYYFREKNFRKSREFVEKLLKKRPGLLDARILYGKVLFESHHFMYAQRQFDLVAKYDRENWEVVYCQAKCLEHMKRYVDAISGYRSVLRGNWTAGPLEDLGRAREESQVAIIHLYIKLKDFYAGIEQVSEFLSSPSSEKTKTELIYLYANLLWNTGEEYKALKNFERVYRMDPEFKDVRILYERFKRIFPHNTLGFYFTSSEEAQGRGFESTCRKILGQMDFDLLHRSFDFFIYAKSGFYEVFWRHIEPLPFSKLTDIQVLMDGYSVKPANIEIYSLSGIREDTVTHNLLRSARLIEGDEFLETVRTACEPKSAGIDKTVAKKNPSL
jgi:tetratricopeptide (TPR) repeat protein